MYELTERVYFFLEKKGWILSKETALYLYLNPPGQTQTASGYVLKIPKKLSNDYHYLMKNIINTIESLYKGNVRTVDSLKKFNENSKRQFLPKAEWIAPEEKSKIEKIGIYDIFIPSD